MSNRFIIRSATTADAAALLAIYRPFVESTTVSFEATPPTVEEFAGRIAKSIAGWAWLVAEADGECLGYAYATSLRERAAYRWAAETAAYVRADQYRRGIGRALYHELFAVLKARGFCNAFAGVALPNDASLGLHTSLGFEPIGVFRRVGFKFDRWCDVAWFQRVLTDQPDPDSEVSRRQ